MKPFIKWPGGKRWLLDSKQITLPDYDGRYIEPFLGGAAVFFYLSPTKAILSDVNSKLINTYDAVRSDWQLVHCALKRMQALHCEEFYYKERARKRRTNHTKAAQFLYLNRTCWNGLYRENLFGEFNVPIGTKTQVLLPDDNFESASKALQRAELRVCDFEETLMDAKKGDLVFLDPPYTTAHNINGFIKYNQNIFSWNDQVRLRRCAEAAYQRGSKIILTNADHRTIHELYADMGQPKIVSRSSVISGSATARGKTTEVVYLF